MNSEDSDKKLNRVSIIFELIVNVGTIASWILGLFSVFVLTIQPSPVPLPGINFPFSSSYQFVLWISSLLAYLHFVRRYWEKNRSNQKFSDNFAVFILTDLLQLKQPLLLIPFIGAIAVGIQIAVKAASTNELHITIFYWIIGILTVMAVIMIPILKLVESDFDRPYELRRNWEANEALKQRWIKRIRKELEVQDSVSTEDFYDVGLDPKIADAHINWALEMYFKKFELEQRLTLSEISWVKQSERGYGVWPRRTLTRRKARP